MSTHKKGNRYDEDFKRTIVELYHSGKTQASLIKDMYNRILIQCLPHGSVEKWLKQRLSADLSRLPKAFFFVS